MGIRKRIREAKREGKKVNERHGARERDMEGKSKM